MPSHTTPWTASTDAVTEAIRESSSQRSTVGLHAYRTRRNLHHPRWICSSPGREMYVSPPGKAWR